MSKPLPKVKLMVARYPDRGTAVIGGEMSGLVNWNDIRYPQMYTSYKNIVSNFWIPQRISMTNDAKQFPLLKDREKEAFLTSIGQLATLDSKQTRAVLAFALYVSEPTYAPIAAQIAAQEAIHNESYSYVLSSLVPLDVQNKVFHDAKHDPMVQKRNARVEQLYDKFINDPTPQNFFEALIGTVVLEGVNFYTAFTLFYNFARNQMMLGSSTMIGYIHRDEVQHAYVFSQMVRFLLAEMPELNTEANVQFIYDMLIEATELEIEWSRYALHGVDGIDLDDLEGYIKKLCNRRLRGLGLEDHYEGIDNAMTWMIAFDDNSDQNTKTDTFEQKSRNYKKVDGDNDLDDL